MDITNLKNKMEEWQIIDIVNDEFLLINKTNDTQTLPLTTKFNDDLQKFTSSLLLKQYKYKGDKKLCHCCLSYKLSKDSEAWKTICKKCWDDGKRTSEPIPLLHHKPCQSCFIPCIIPSSTITKCPYCYKKTLKKCISCDKMTDKNTCYECYKQSLNKDNARECKVCHQFLISLNEPKYKTMCSTCYRQSKQL